MDKFSCGYKYFSSCRLIFLEHQESEQKQLDSSQKQTLPFKPEDLAKLKESGEEAAARAERHLDIIDMHKADERDAAMTGRIEAFSDAKGSSGNVTVEKAISKEPAKLLTDKELGDISKMEKISPNVTGASQDDLENLMAKAVQKPEEEPAVADKGAEDATTKGPRVIKLEPIVFSPSPSKEKIPADKAREAKAQEKLAGYIKSLSGGAEKKADASKEIAGLKWPKNVEKAKIVEGKAEKAKLGIYEVTDSNVNFRNEKGQVIAQIDKGQKERSQVVVLSPDRYSVDGHNFVKAQYAGQTGYITDEYLYLTKETTPEWIANFTKPSEKAPTKIAGESGKQKPAG